MHPKILIVSHNVSLPMSLHHVRHMHNAQWTVMCSELGVLYSPNTFLSENHLMPKNYDNDVLTQITIIWNETILMFSANWKGPSYHIEIITSYAPGI